MITFGTMAAKLAVKDVARIYNLPIPESNRLTQMIPDRPIVVKENGEDKDISALGYDTFPEGFEEFIEKCNEIAGGNYLTTGESLQELSPEFLTEVFGVTDEDVKGGNLQDVIDTLELNMYEVTRVFSMREKLDAYYATTKEEELAPFRPVELYEEASSEEEVIGLYDKELHQAKLNQEKNLFSAIGWKLCRNSCFSCKNWR